MNSKHYHNEDLKNVIWEEPQPLFSFSFSTYIEKIKAKKRTLYYWGIIGFIVGIIFAFGNPKTYQTTVELSPEVTQKTSEGLKGLSSLLNSSLDKATSTDIDAFDATFYPQIVCSTPFLLELMQEKIATEEGDTLTVENYIKEERNSLLETVVGIPITIANEVRELINPAEDTPLLISTEKKPSVIGVPRKQQKIMEALGEKHISVVIDEKQNIVSISAIATDRMVSAQLAHLITEQLQNYITHYRIAKAQQNYDYLTALYAQRKAEYQAIKERYASYIDSNKRIVLQTALTERDMLKDELDIAYQTYSQIASQVEMARIKLQEARPIFAVIEPAVIPLQPIGIGRIMTILVSTILFTMLSAIWILSKDLFQKDTTEKNSPV